MEEKKVFIGETDVLIEKLPCILGLHMDGAYTEIKLSSDKDGIKAHIGCSSGAVLQVIQEL